MEVAERICRHCGTVNLVANCEQDSKPFVLTEAHVEGRLRVFDDGPVRQLPDGFRQPLCDFCSTNSAGSGPSDVVNAGLQQKTCPVCHTEFLSEA